MNWRPIIEDIYDHYNHKSIRIRYHIIFVTKYRRKCLEGIKEQVFNAFREVESKSHIKIHNMNIDKNHIHLLISFPPEYSISQTVNRLKQYTTNYLYRNCNDHMRLYYWNKKRVLWSHSYFCSTLGVISDKIVKEYINNQ